MVSPRRVTPSARWVALALLMGGLILSVDVALAQAPDIQAIEAAIRERGLGWTPREYRRTFSLGLVDEAPASDKTPLTLPRVYGLPATLDWRDHGGNWVSPVKDQGECGSCWAFAGVAALEARYALAQNTPGAFLDLSEQILIACAAGNAGCEGGAASVTAEFLKTMGAYHEACYPYIEAQGVCADACADWAARAYKIAAYEYVPPEIGALKQALQEGPFQVGLDVYQDLYNYGSGVYEHAWGEAAGSHAVLLVGYVDTPGRYGGGYFIAKNSWHSSWGEGGFFRIGYSQVTGEVNFGKTAYRYYVPAPTPDPAPMAVSFSPATDWLAGMAYHVGGWASQNTYPRAMGDVNGDGRADIVGFGRAATQVALAEGAGFASPTEWVASYAVDAGGWTSFDRYPRLLGDVNGDGLADVVGFGQRAVCVALSTGTGFARPQSWIEKYVVTRGGWTSQNIYPRAVGDVNGDGLADVVGFGERGIQVSLSTGTSFAAPEIWMMGFGSAEGGWTSQEAMPRTVADVDGDGRADAIGFGRDGVYVALSQGNRFEPPARWIANYGWGAGGWQGQDRYPRALADVNGDGKADIVGLGEDAAYVSLSTGAGFSTAQMGIANYGVAAGGWYRQDIYPRLLGDVNGDGRADIVGCAYVSTVVSLAD